MAEEYATITRDQLARKLETHAPDNESAREGFALVNVLGQEAFEREHIPGSINVPADEIDELEQRFDEGKEIIVYCASPSCDASPKVARKLAERGFRRVVDYEGGMSDWRKGGQPISGKAA